MDALIPLAIGAIIVVAFLAVFALVQSGNTTKLAEDLRTRVRDLETELRKLRRESGEHPAPAEPPHTATPPPIPVAPPHIPVPPPIPKPAPIPTSAFVPKEEIPPSAPEPDLPRHSVGTQGSWEEFMGAKLFAWIGGLALFLGIAFFVKYSFEHNLISPAMRVTIGFVSAFGLLAGGIRMKRKENAVTAQTLCATGILVLYAVTYACRCYYHFPFFALDRTFALMALITAVAFMIAVRMNAMVVAVLGVAGGFLTPGLLNTGQDYALPLFGYIAALDIGLLAIARRQRWSALSWLGSIGTVFIQAGWFFNFFEAEHYWVGNKIFGAMAILAGFQFLFLAAAWRAPDLKGTRGAAAITGCAAMLGAFYFLQFHSLGYRPVLLCGYLFVVDAALITLSLFSTRAALIQTGAGIAAYIFLISWTEMDLVHSNLTVALGCYFAFALLHGMLPFLLRRGKETPIPAWSNLFPLASFAFALVPILQFDNLSRIVWPFVLLLDCLVFLVAVLTGALATILAALILSLITIGAAMLQGSAPLAGLDFNLGLIGACAVLFLAATAWIARGMRAKKQIEGVAPHLPALSALMPFTLLMMAILQLPLADPSPVFGLGLFLAVLLLGLAVWLSLDALPLVALGAVLALQYTWRITASGAAHPLLAIRWGLIFYVVFTIFPFFFRRRLVEKNFAWIAAALAGPLHFYLIHWAIDHTYPRIAPGLPPALFALPSLLGLAFLARKKANQIQLAFFGGAALFFITLIFPLQFHREWITISWALEGAALCWLFRRVPHPGLRLTGVALLVVSFIRLALNPLILGYHPRADHPLFNWYLYAFGAVAAAHFLAARLLAKPRNLVLGANVLPLLCSLGTILLFLLVNLEIADYFTAPHQSVLTLDFSGNFARDMSYSIAWAMFALVLLVIGIRRRIASVRYSSLGLLGAAILKLFLHDLSQLDQLYRIGAFIAVAIIAILSSFLYQRFLAHEPQDQN